MAIFNRVTEETTKVVKNGSTRVKIGDISVCYVIPGLAIEEFESVPETLANGHNPRIIARSKKGGRCETNAGERIFLEVLSHLNFVVVNIGYGRGLLPLLVAIL